MVPTLELLLFLLLLLRCCLVSGCSRNLTVVFCSQWQFGHISPMLPAAAEAARRGHTVHFCIPKSEHDSAAALLSRIDGGLLVRLAVCGSGPTSAAKEEIRDALSKSASGYWAMMSAVNAFLDDGSDSIGPFAALVEQTRPSSVVVDVATIFPLLALSLVKDPPPLLLHFPGFQSHLDAKWSSVHIPLLTSTLPVSSTGGLAAWAENALSNVLWWHLGRNIAAAARVANLPASFLQDLFHRMHQSVVILTSVHGLSPIQANTPQVRHIGYRLAKEVFQTRKESLGGRRVVVSVGTMVLPAQSLLLCIADSIALLPKDVAVLWSVRGLKNEVLDLLKSRVGTRELKMLPWINQSEELCDSSTSVFVSHAGFNSIAESLLCGVPMLLLPFFGDQHSNARKIESAGAGLIAQHDACDSFEMSQQLTALLTLKQYANAASKWGALLQRAGGFVAAVDLIEEVSTYGYAHLVPMISKDSWHDSSFVPIILAFLVCKFLHKLFCLYF